MENDSTQQTLFVSMVIANWDLQNRRLVALLNGLSDEELLSETASGRNTGTYILGHLIAVSDGILPLLGLQDKLYPHLQHIFIDNADKAGLTFPSIATLKENLQKVNEVLSQHFKDMPVNEWFTRHLAMTDEDFNKEPQRNKLNILINRTNHLSYHLGQLIYLKN